MARAFMAMVNKGCRTGDDDCECFVCICYCALRDQSDEIERLLDEVERLKGGGR